MATELKFETIPGLSKSDFSGQVRVAKDGDGNFRSFGVSYQGTMVWVADENWYKAWIAGDVIAGSIILKEEQRMTTLVDETTKEAILLNGRKQYVPVEGEKILTMVGLKTKKELEMEDELEVWNKTRSFRKKEKLFEIAKSYNEAAVKAAETATLSTEQSSKLEAMMADLGF